MSIALEKVKLFSKLCWFDDFFHLPLPSIKVQVAGCWKNGWNMSAQVKQFGRNHVSNNQTIFLPSLINAASVIITWFFFEEMSQKGRYFPMRCVSIQELICSETNSQSTWTWLVGRWNFLFRFGLFSGTVLAVSCQVVGYSLANFVQWIFWGYQLWPRCEKMHEMHEIFAASIWKS